jgi:hypothetical protein
MPIKDRCQPIRDDISALEKEIQDLRDVLNEVPPSLKRTILERIKREQVHLMRLRRALKICETAH